MDVEPNIDWYLSVSREREVGPRCPFATVESCPRYFASVSLLRHLGHTSISDEEDQRLQKKWEHSGLIPRIAEQDTCVFGSPASKCMNNYCPEVSFESFGVFASLLHEHGDEIDRDFAFKRLTREKAPIASWKWRWADLKPMHYTECPLYSSLRHQASSSTLHNPRPEVGALKAGEHDSEETKSTVAGAKADDDLVSRWKRRKLVAYIVAGCAVVTGIATFTDSLSKIKTNISEWFSARPINTVKLPFDSGWILAGYYDRATGRFTDARPHVQISRTSRHDHHILPEIGDWIQIVGERNVIIPQYKSSGLAHQMEAPLADLRDEDYTGVKLPSGTTMEVRDIGGGSYPGRAEAVWLRVGAIPQ